MTQVHPRLRILAWGMGLLLASPVLALDWIDWSSDRGTPPANAVPAGTIVDSGTCFTCSALHHGGGALNTHAGKLCKYNERWSCFIGNGGVEQRYEAYRVLVGDPDSVHWETATSSAALPTDTVWAGRIVDSGDCYPCRAKHTGGGAENTHPGKLCHYDGRWSCFIGNGGVEQRYEIYEVMVHGRTPTDLAVPVRGQETPMWCWAGGGQMAMQYLGATVAQCDQANARFGRNDCCTISLCPSPATSGPCVQGGWPEFSKWGFSARETAWGSALTFQQLQAEIANRRPVPFAWGWVGGGGHLMVARGVSTVAGVNYVHINDPWSPCQGGHRLITYADWVARAGDHAHWRDYYELRRRVNFITLASVAGGAGGRVVEPTAQPAAGGPETKPLPAPATPPEAAGLPVHKSPKEAAAATLAALGADASTQAVVGLAPGERATPSVQEPLREVLVRLDELKAFTAKQDAGALLHDTGGLFMPVSVASRVTSGVTVTKAGGGFRTVSVGDESLAAAVQANVSKAPTAKGSEQLIVRVPALGAVFVGQLRKGKLLLIPLTDDPRFSLKKGEPVPAATVFERMVPAARELKADQPG